MEKDLKKKLENYNEQSEVSCDANEEKASACHEHCICNCNECFDYICCCDNCCPCCG